MVIIRPSVAVVQAARSGQVEQAGPKLAYSLRCGAGLIGTETAANPNNMMGFRKDMGVRSDECGVRSAAVRASNEPSHPSPPPSPR